MRKFLYGLFFIVLLGACSDYDQPLGADIQPTNEIKSIYTIPVDEALASLEDFLAEDEQLNSRNGQKRTVSSLMTVAFDKVCSRADNDSLGCQNLLYIANFDNNEGYAVLAGDRRIGSPIIAITNSGEINQADIDKVEETREKPERPIVEGYPTTGPGFFTDTRYGDELFINPNTVDMYDPTEDDTLVGDFELDKDDVVQGLEIYEDPIDSKNLPFVQIVDFAENELVNNGNDNHLGNSPVDGYVGIGVGGGTPGSIKETKETTILSESSRLLDDFWDWHQGSPFNDLYPEKRKWLVFGPKKKAPAGCMPLAVAKIVTYFEFPFACAYENQAINLSALKEDYFSKEGSRSASLLLKKISDYCNCMCFYNGTFTFPHKASDFLKSMGLINVKSYEFTFTRAKDMIDKGNPMIISSIPQHYAVWNSHAWNIDGYKVKKVRVKKDWYQGSKIVHTETTEHTYEMVHCAFGWGGAHDGYYIAGVFKLNYKDNELDGPRESGNTHYKHNTKIIMYDRR